MSAENRARDEFLYKADPPAGAALDGRAGMTDPEWQFWLRNTVADHLADIERLFASSRKISIIIRDPSQFDGENDVLVTDDTEEMALRAMERMFRREAALAATEPPSELSR